MDVNGLRLEVASGGVPKVSRSSPTIPTDMGGAARASRTGLEFGLQEKCKERGGKNWVDGDCEGVRVPARMEVGRYKGTTKSCRTAATLPQIQQRNKATELGLTLIINDLLASAEIRQEDHGAPRAV